MLTLFSVELSFFLLALVMKVLQVTAQVPEQAGEEDDEQDDPHPERYGGSLVLDQKDPHLDAPGLSSGESAALWAGVSLLLLLLTCGLWNLCGSCRTRITCRMQSLSGGRRKKKKLNPTEKRVNKILSNDSAREILKAHALTAMNSQVDIYPLSTSLLFQKYF